MCNCDGTLTIDLCLYVMYACFGSCMHYAVINASVIFASLILVCWHRRF